MAPKRETAQEIWGNELRHAIEAVGTTGRQLAEALNVEPSTVSNWINGRRTPHIKDVERIEEILGTNGYLKRDLKWVNREISPEWSEWREVEEDASELLAVETTLINGLLQSPEYAHVILGSDDLVQERLQRQAILTKDDPAFFEVLLDESVLYHKVGSDKIMADALTHLAKMAERDNIVLRFIPFSSDVCSKLAGPFH